MYCCDSTQRYKKPKTNYNALSPLPCKGRNNCFVRIKKGWPNICTIFNHPFLFSIKNLSVYLSLLPAPVKDREKEGDDGRTEPEPGYIGEIILQDVSCCILG